MFTVILRRGRSVSKWSRRDESTARAIFKVATVAARNNGGYVKLVKGLRTIDRYSN